jgi:hypothetical protein
VALPVWTVMAVTGRGRRLALVAAGAYAAACIAAGEFAGRGQPVDVRTRIPAAFVVMHVAWGAGFWAGALEAARGTETGGGSPPPLSPLPQMA